MITLLFDIIMLIMPFLLIWLLGGCIAVWLHYAETVREGMVKIGRAVFNFLKPEDAIPSTDMIPIPDYQLQPLTTELNPYFNVLVLLSANANADLQTVIYRQSGCSINLDIIEIIYRKFIQNKLNLNVNTPLFIYVDIDEEYLYLYGGISIQAQKLIEEARNNRRSRQQSTVNKDIIE